MKYLKAKNAIGIFVLYCLLNSNIAVASCLRAAGDGTVTPNLPSADLQMLDTEVGERKLLGWSAEEVFFLFGGVSGITCPNGLSAWSSRPSYLPSPIGSISAAHTSGTRSYPIYPTEYKNIGYIVHVYGVRNQYDNALSGNHLAWPMAQSGIGVRHQIQFVILGQLLPGTYTLAPTQIAETSASYSSSTFMPYQSWPIFYSSSTITVTGATCNIDTSDKNKTVDMMGSTSVQNFHGVGSTTRQVSFSLKIDCEAGVTVQAGMTDATHSSNDTEILTLDHSSTATGVGIQVFAYDNPVRFGTGLNTDNIWGIGGSASAPETTYIVPFTANYVQTESNITAGTISAKSTILLSYK